MTPQTHYWGLGHQVITPASLSLIVFSLIVFSLIAAALAVMMLAVRRAHG